MLIVLKELKPYIIWQKYSVYHLKNIEVARKSIVANKRIEKGDVFSEDNLICKRPGNGISPMEWDQIIGTSASQAYEEDDLIVKI